MTELSLIYPGSARYFDSVAEASTEFFGVSVVPPIHAPAIASVTECYCSLPLRLPSRLLSKVTLSRPYLENLKKAEGMFQEIIGSARRRRR